LSAVFLGIAVRLFGIYTPGEGAGWPEFLNMSEALYALAVLMIVAHTLYSQVWARMVSLTIWTGSSLVALAGLGYQRLHGLAVQGSTLDTVQFILAGLVSVTLMEVFSQMSALQIRSAVQNSLLQRYALTDALTELPNRRGFQNACQREFAPERRKGSPMSLIVLDIDRFKQINDDCGHDRGDCVLRQVAQVVRSVTGPTHYPVRWGGDEFAILLPGCGLDQAREIAERVRSEVESYRFHLGPVTVSLGMAEYCGDTSPDSLFKRADQALYRAKRLGRNRTETEELPGGASSLESVDNLRSAIESRTQHVRPEPIDRMAS
jgi:diguanylate cyclase (GGDEF)-like protein